MKQVLIMFISKYPRYEGCNYIEIWCRFAHDAFINRRKVQIQEFEFQSSKNVEAIEMSFSNLFQPIDTQPRQTAFVEEVNRTFAGDDDEDVGPEIQFLCQGIRNLAIQ